MSRAGLKPKPAPKPIILSTKADDDWDTDPDFVNNMSEKELRWGAKTVEGSGHQESVKLSALRKEVLEADKQSIQKRLEAMPKPSEGYGGKFGVQKDRMDKVCVYPLIFIYGCFQSAETFEYAGKVEAHASQKDYSRGFGGKYGVETDKKDKSAVGWDDHEKLQQHESQKGGEP